MRLTVEEHGGGCQMVRLRAWPRCSRGAAMLCVLLIVICDAAAFAQAWETWAASGIIGLALLAAIFRDIGSAMNAVRHATPGWKRQGK